MIEKLEKQAKDWNFTVQLQCYISAIEDKAKAQNNNIPIDTLEWLKWAKLHLKRINPLTGSLPTYTKAKELLGIEDIIDKENRYRF